MILAAAFAAVVLMLATAIPAWAALKGSASSDSAAAASFVRSSAGTTATATTRTEDLSVATFVGRIPFVQQLRYLDALAGTAPQAQRFIEGARQASLAGYLGDVGSQMLPSLGDAPGTKAAIDTWAAATAERQAAAEAERQAAASADAVHSVWQAPAAVAGSRIPDASVTFYACVGDGFCGAMANGQQVFEGAAACSPDLPFGTRFVIASDPASRVFVCLDRGALSPTWVDVWFYDATQGYAWQSAVGTRSDIIIVE